MYRLRDVQSNSFSQRQPASLLVTNKGDANLVRLVLFDPATGKEEPVESDPMNRVDFGGARFSDVSDELIVTIYQDDKPRIYFKDKSTKLTTNS